MAIVASISNGILLVAQLFAWTSMIIERSQDLGLEDAIVSTIEGQELCSVCIIVRSETEKQQEARQLQVVDVFAKFFSSGSPDDSDIVPQPRSRRAGYMSTDESAPLEFVAGKLGPPPRLAA